MRWRAVVAAFGLGLAMPLAASAAENELVARGQYLVRIMDCGGCHTDGALAGKPDMTRQLAGSSIGFEIPNLGIFYPPNLTQDAKTGLGQWKEADIITAIRTGVRPDGRQLAPVMPWHSYSALVDEDARAVAAYLKSLPPLPSAAHPLAGPGERAPGPYLSVVLPK